jgi:hypothetical protein
MGVKTSYGEEELEETEEKLPFGGHCMVRYGLGSSSSNRYGSASCILDFLFLRGGIRVKEGTSGGDCLKMMYKHASAGNVVLIKMMVMMTMMKNNDNRKC